MRQSHADIAKLRAVWSNEHRVADPCRWSIMSSDVALVSLLKAWNAVFILLRLPCLSFFADGRDLALARITDWRSIAASALRISSGAVGSADPSFATTLGVSMMCCPMPNNAHKSEVMDGGMTPPLGSYRSINDNGNGGSDDHSAFSPSSPHLASSKFLRGPSQSDNINATSTRFDALPTPYPVCIIL